jgi:uncharacterized protein (DUF433 family)
VALSLADRIPDGSSILVDANPLVYLFEGSSLAEVVVAPIRAGREARRGSSRHDAECGAARIRREAEAGMNRADRITIDPGVMQGKPVIRGTRVTVDLLLRKLSEGASETDLLDAYPHITTEDIRAALAYAADTVSHEQILVTAASDTGA